MGMGHAERNRSYDLARLSESVPPAADMAPYEVDVKIEHARVLVDVHLCKRRLADARRTVQVNEAQHSRSLGSDAGHVG